MKSRPSKQLLTKKTNTMLINLQNDKTVISDYIAKRVSSFIDSPKVQLGDSEDKIQLILVGFEASQTGFVSLIFDSRPDAACDGEWTMAFEDESIEFSSWEQAIDEAFEKSAPLVLIKDNGDKVSFLLDDDDPTEYIGELLCSVFKTNIENGLFSKLPISDDCKFYIEDMNGCYAWSNES